MSVTEKKYKTSILSATSCDSELPLDENKQYEEVGQCHIIQSDSDSSSKAKPIISLKFCCSDTSAGQRRLCKSFWEAIDKHPELDRIIARGWSEKEEVPKLIAKKTLPTPPCDELQEFLDRHVDKLVLLGVKAHTKYCTTNLSSNQSSANILEDLQDFDDKVKTEISIPPKTPRLTHSQEMLSTSSSTKSKNTQV